MSIYHCSLKIINRASGRSSVAAAAYRAGEKLHNQRENITHDFTKKQGIVFKQILLPEQAPPRFKSRNELWNEVEKAEKRSDAQTAREIELALPVELKRNQQIDLVRQYITDNFTSKGMCADFAIHDKNDGNPHAHVLLTMRSLTPDGFGKKDRSWNQHSNAEYWRAQWADIYNKQLEKLGIEQRVDHRSFKRQGIPLQPTIHLGTAAHQLEKQGIATERGEINRQIKLSNQRYQQINTELDTLQHQQKVVFGEIRDDLSAVSNKYLLTAVELSERQHTHTAHTQRSALLLHQSADLIKRAQNIKQYDSRLTQLQRGLETINPLALDEIIEHKQQITHLENSKNQATLALQRDYILTPDQVPVQAQLLQEQAGQQPQSTAIAGDSVEWLFKLLESLGEAFIKYIQLLTHYGEVVSLPEIIAEHNIEPSLSSSRLALEQAQNQLSLLLEQAQPHTLHLEQSQNLTHSLS
jgi:hypothetical protein